MIEDCEIPELQLFRREEAALPLVHRPELGTLVTFADNDASPIHGWYRFKEGFSGSLLEKIINDLGTEIGRKFRLLDPFCGSGTTLLSAQSLAKRGYEIDAVGIERNPFIAFAARTKTRWAEIDPDSLLSAGEEAIKSSQHLSPMLPELSSIREGRCISQYTAKRIISLRDSIYGDNATSDGLRLGLAAAIEPLSKVRKDGRALRLVSKTRRQINSVIREKWEAIAADCKLSAKSKAGEANIRVIEGDGRSPTNVGLEYESFDLIFTSPPYPNNIDYSEVYKLELWLMGHIKNQAEFLKLRRSTFRSHPAYEKNSPFAPEFEKEASSGSLEPLLGRLLNRIDASAESWRASLLKAYFGDLWLSLKQFHKLLRAGGYAVLTVGNSLHGVGESPFLIATDLILANMATTHGFEVKQISIARNLKRRLSGNHFLRESIVTLKKGNGH